MLTFLAPLLAYLLSFPVMLVSLFRVEIGILYFITLVPIIAVMKKFAEWPQGNNFADYMLVAIVLGWFVKRHKKNKPVFESSPMNWVVILFILGSIFNLVWGYISNDFSGYIDLLRLVTWKNYMILPILYFVALNTIDNEDMVKWIIICICFAMLAMVFNFYSTFRWMPSEHYSHGIRISGPFSFLGPNEMGIFFAQYTLLLFGISYFIDDKRLKSMVIFVCACCMYPILYSYSRGAYVCFITGCMALGFLKDKRIFVVMGALIILYSIILPNSVVERIDMTFLNKEEISENEMQRSAFDFGDTTIQITGRKELWDKASAYFKENPVLGIGFDTFRHLEGAITHSMYFKILAEQGLLGMIIFLIFSATVLQQSYKLFRKSRSRFGKGIGLGLLTCQIVNFSGSAAGDQSLYYNLMAIYWLFLGIVASFNNQFVDDTNATNGKKQ